VSDLPLLTWVLVLAALVLGILAAILKKKKCKKKKRRIDKK